jgi:hypothetical protein
MLYIRLYVKFFSFIIVDLVLSLYAGFSMFILTTISKNLVNEYTSRYKLPQNQTTLGKNLGFAKNKFSNK